MTGFWIKLFGSADSKETIYERIGGEAALNVIVDVFYRKVLADVRINHYFKNVDLNSTHDKKKAFLSLLLGGPSIYSGKELRLGHAHLVEDSLNNSHFDAIVENLKASLIELGLPASLTAEATSKVEQQRGDVLAGYTAEEKAIIDTQKSL